MSGHTPPETPQQALRRARRHARVAAAEAVAALHALLDAAALSTLGEAAAAHGALAPLARLFHDLTNELDPRTDGDEARLLAGVMAALGDEITRWETRAQDDSDARLVLRTLLGLREILWELGGRPKAAERSPRPRPARHKPGPRRVQRVKVE
ncbi:MAG: hypothetical protein JRH16_10765 [Deltaproteobacteria bacterium]|nr:hypothetical protein [Deltaproteobacteria bacterium]